MQALRLSYYSTLGSRVRKKKERRREDYVLVQLASSAVPASKTSQLCGNAPSVHSSTSLHTHPGVYMGYLNYKKTHPPRTLP